MVLNDGCMVINMLADPNNREYELWEDGESFAIGRSGNHRGVAMRLNITELATYCQMHQLTYKTEDENETEPMFGSLEEIINDLNAEQQVQHCRLVNMAELKVYIYWKKLQKFTDEKGYILLDTADMPDPDLLIRTSGEERLSNFLLWQLAYSEFYFADVLWPDFNKDELVKAIEAYNGRDRRFGNAK